MGNKTPITCLAKYATKTKCCFVTTLRMQPIAQKNAQVFEKAKLKPKFLRLEIQKWESSYK